MYHIHYSGETRGPYLIEQIRSMWSSGIITADTVYWNEAHSAWEPIVELIEIAPPSDELKRQPPGRPAGTTPELQQMIPQVAGALPPALPVPMENSHGRTRYAAINGMLGFGIPLAAGGLLVQLIFFHESIAAFFGFALLVIPASLWQGYRFAVRQWNAKAVQGNPPKSNGCAVAFLTAIWVPVIVIILVINYGKATDRSPSASSNVISLAAATPPREQPATLPSGQSAGSRLRPAAEDRPVEVKAKPRTSQSAARDQFEKAVSYDRQGDISGALAAYQNAVALYPEYQQAWYALGVCHLKHKNAEGAIAALNKAGSLVPTDANTQYQLVLAYAGSGSYIEANFVRHRLEHLDASLETQLIRSFEVGLVQRFATLDYPDLGLKNSPLNHEFIARYNAYKERNSSILDHHDWPIEVAKEAVAAIASAAGNTRQAPVAQKTSAEAKAVNSTTVQMESAGNTFTVSAQLNGALETRFIFDTGASYVCVPEDVFRRLQAMGSVRETFSRPDESITTANGTEVKAHHFIVQSIKVGESTAPNVEAITYPGAVPLLGQTFLSKFKTWSVDNNNARLILTGRVPEAPISFQALEIAQYVTPPPLGSAMENQTQKAARRYEAELEVMRKIETMGLYATAIRTLDQATTLADGNGDWVLERGETFPFLGFTSDTARVKIGTTWFSVPRDAVEVVRLSEHPELAQKHQEILRQARLQQ